MSTMPSHTQPEFSAASVLVKPSVETVAGRPAKVKNDQLTTSRSSLGKQASLAFAYYMIVFSVGIAATLAWQIYGGAARQLIAPAASIPDQQQLNAISFDLDAVRRSIDGLAIAIGTSIATSQEQITRSVDQLAAGQEQMTREITKLQAVERYVLYKNSDPPPRPAPAQLPKPAPRPSQAPTVLTPAKNRFGTNAV
jgi:hypothetical protein